MRPGEYEVNGVRYKWTCVGQWEHFEHFVPQGWLACSHFPDIEKADKARHELAEAESVEWVEIDDDARIQRDGSDPQVRHEGGICVWRGLTNPIDKRWPKAYRKGREVALEQVRELVEAVEAVQLPGRSRMVYGAMGEMVPLYPDWQRIRDAAWKVKL